MPVLQGLPVTELAPHKLQPGQTKRVLSSIQKTPGLVPGLLFGFLRRLLFLWGHGWFLLILSTASVFFTHAFFAPDN